MATADPAYAILLSRIRLAVRRATGLMVDVEILLKSPKKAGAQIAEWRALKSADLDQLLIQYEKIHLKPVQIINSSDGGGLPAAQARTADSIKSVNSSTDAAESKPAKPLTKPRYIQGAR
jgi:hypothetical protein